jgi:C1A family cysteine protease
VRQFLLKSSPRDDRDWIYQRSDLTPQPKVDLREWDSAVDSQLDLGSCAGNAMANAYELQVRRQAPENFVELSRLFIYYNARAIDNSINQDSGAYLRDVVKAVQDHGICKEALWPYNVENFAVRPSAESFEDARPRSLRNYYKLDTIEDIVDALSQLRPVIFGMEIYDSFMRVNTENPVVPMPATDEQRHGGHAMCMVGYRLPEQQFLAKNSFGTAWGDQGYCWIPFEYLEQQGYDRWVFDIWNPVLNRVS